MKTQRRSSRPSASPRPAKNPFAQFEEWFTEARQAGVATPEAMVVATTDRRGQPSARVVLLKSVSPKGFVFYTNYESKKARELSSNPKAALVFHWDALQKQVRIEGEVVLASRAESDRYFATRDRGSQIGAWASEQSRAISGRKELEERIRAFEDRFAGRDVPRPPHWGGYRVVPARIEFWSGREHRLHDRILYERKNGKWTVSRLSP